MDLVAGDGDSGFWINHWFVSNYLLSLYIIVSSYVWVAYI